MYAKHKNKLATVLLVAILWQVFIPLAVFISILAVKISQESFIRQNFSETALFERLVLTESEYKKLNRVNEKEILFNHMLFDIHSVKKEKGKYILLLLNDKKEKELEETAEFAVDLNKKENTGAFAILFAFLFHENPDVFFFTQNTNDLVFFSIKRKFTKDIRIPVPSPPPDTWA